MLPYWIVDRVPVVYPCGHGICCSCNFLLQERRCPFCKMHLNLGATKNICLIAMLQKTESYFTGKPPSDDTNSYKVFEQKQALDPYDLRPVRCIYESNASVH